jgi:hypothetical protein
MTFIKAVGWYSHKTLSVWQAVPSYMLLVTPLVQVTNSICVAMISFAYIINYQHGYSSGCMLVKTGLILTPRQSIQ